MPLLKVGLCPALTSDVLMALKVAGYRSVIDFVSDDLENVAHKSGVSYKELAAIRRVLLAQYSAFPVNGADLYEDVVSSVAILSTGCSSLDELLDGGLYTAEVTEVMGSPAAGKTQICLSAAVTVAKETEQNVLYVDTGGGFDIQRIQDILGSRTSSEMVAETVCSRIHCHQAFDVFELLSHLEDVRNSLAHQVEGFYSSLKLLVIDCVASVISPILGGQQTDGHGFMMHLARLLKSLALDYSIAVLITNNVVKDGETGVKAALGRTWSHMPDVRLEILRDTMPSVKAECNESVVSQRLAILKKSSRQRIGIQTPFVITQQGLTDVPTRRQSESS